MNSKKITLINAENQKGKRYSDYYNLLFFAFGFLLWYFKDDLLMLGLSLVHLLFFISSIYLGPSKNYYEFTDKGIYEPPSWQLSKRKYLAYEEIQEAIFVVGDYVFRNKHLEIRLPKELVKEQDVPFLEEKLAEIQDEIVEKSCVEKA